jgi:hypothetical protein
MRWLVIFFLVLILFSGLGPWLRKIGLGRLPGDFRVQFAGREFHLPLASSLLLSFVAMWIVHWV